MADFDIAISMGEGLINKALQVMYDRPTLRGSLFSGSQGFDVEDASMSVQWALSEAPHATLSVPTSDQWKNAVKAGGETAAPEDDAFILRLPSTTLGLSGGASSGQGKTRDFDLICTARIDNNEAALKAVAIVVEEMSTAPMIDRAMYRVLLPKLLDAANGALAGAELPNISLPISFGPANLRILAGRIVAVARLDGAAAPEPPENFPADEFAVLLSPAAIQRAIDLAMPTLQNLSESTNGSTGFGIGRAEYSASISLTGLTAQVDQADPTRLHAQTNASLSAGAGVDLLGPLGDIANQAGEGIVIGANAVKDTAVDAGNAIASGAQDVGNTIASGAEDAARTVAGGFEDAGNSIKEAFSSY
jgi:hypothetical protein